MAKLSTKQLLALGPGVQLIEACPGAGKTRAVVTRFAEHAGRSDKGVALLSFTNAAIDEAGRRCADRPDAVRSPNFVGTFDAFLHRYITTPYIASKLGVRARYLQAWSDLNTETVLRVSGVPGVGVEIDQCVHQADGTVIVVAQKLPSKQQGYYDQLNESQKDQILSMASRRITSFNERGLHSSESARLLALRALGSSWGADRLRRLAIRFNELIVDEFQDCSPLEQTLLDKFRTSGIHVVLVADPDQAIYGFRQVDPDVYGKYRERINNNKVVDLDENYRSSKIICALVSSLASSGSTIKQLGDGLESAPGTVALISCPVSSARSKFESKCHDAGIALAQSVVLAHGSNDARKLASNAIVEPSGEAFMGRYFVLNRPGFRGGSVMWNRPRSGRVSEGSARG